MQNDCPFFSSEKNFRKNHLATSNGGHSPLHPQKVGRKSNWKGKSPDPEALEEEGLNNLTHFPNR